MAEDKANGVAAHKRLQTIKDLNAEELALYRADRKARNLILLGLPDEVYSSVDSFTTTKAMWKVIERLMQGIEVGK